MNKDQLDNLALQCWGGDLVCYKYFDHHKFLALVDAERAKEQEPAAWAVLSEVEGFNFIAAWPEACHEHINDYYTQCLENGDEIEKCSVIALYTHPQPAPEGYKLVPDAVISSFPEINPSNYNHEDVCTLNDWGTQLVLATIPEH